MKAFGGLLFFLGAGSLLLNLLGMEFKLLGWIDQWGTTPGLALRAGLMVVGAALWFYGRRQAAALPARP